MADLIVLGTCGAWPEPGRSCSGFLLSHQGFRVVLDLGYGTAARLLEHCPDGAVDAVIVTHQHPDHCVDVSALGRVRHYLNVDGPRLPLYCPPGVARVLEALEPRPHPGTVFDIHDLAEPADVGPFRLDTWRLPHHVPNYGVRLTAPGVTVAYTGDSGPSQALADLGRDADLFIVDCTSLEPGADPDKLKTAGEAGFWATQAGAKRLLLTHFWPGSDRQAFADQAQAAFDGDVIVAEENLVVSV